jgi:hypothetical protein
MAEQDVFSKNCYVRGYEGGAINLDRARTCSPLSVTVSAHVWQSSIVSLQVPSPLWAGHGPVE